ncbi:hypothetical protein [Allokutzneria albata]|uniref:Uncharacterized protein n=1 Tax=Allokutzneria albata TaxID=211114 RepID=A0A1G9VF52_ALLAB|nr:hypothetical protein [Allokutzneria albata]SDM70740.1 hypothetical protein SAMN04489726_3001 [Allokutzneria albata]
MTLQRLWLADVDGNLIQPSAITLLTLRSKYGERARPDTPQDVTLHAELGVPDDDGDLHTHALTPALPYAGAAEMRKQLVQLLARLGDTETPAIIQVSLQDNVIRWTVDRLSPPSEA